MDKGQQVMPELPFEIRPVRTPADLDATVQLFTAYAASLDVDLAYQSFPAEMAAMPGKYAPPAGELLLARNRAGTPVGCVGLRPLTPAETCEVKRLYVPPEGRGLGIGRALIEAIVATARSIGYRDMKLDTLPSMASAIALYRKAGFTPIPPYYKTPVAGTIFLGRPLTDNARPDVVGTQRSC